MVHFDCPQCGKRLNIDSGFRGAVARCEHCGALISVPPKGETMATARTRPAEPGDSIQAEHAEAGAVREVRSKWSAGVIFVILAAAVMAAVFLWIAAAGGVRPTPAGPATSPEPPPPEPTTAPAGQGNQPG